MPSTPPPGQPHYLPLPSWPLIKREREVAAVVELLYDHRLEQLAAI